jgi:hypothetical protein
MKSLPHFLRSALSFLAPALVLSLVPACSLQLEAGIGFSRGDGTGAGAGGNEFGSGGGTGGSIDVRPTPPPDASNTFADLCGGGCMSGDASFSCSASGMGGAGGPGAQLSCTVAPVNGKPVAECTPPGTGTLNDPCQSAADCGPGLGCVGTGANGGACRAYCCGDPEACPQDAYCDDVPMAEDDTLRIPACILAAKCDLLNDASCPAGQTCTLVRNNGLTSCVVAGTKQLDEACSLTESCAAGLLCVLALNKCQKLCHVGGTDCPAGSLCQGGSSSFPSNIGICVGMGK